METREMTPAQVAEFLGGELGKKDVRPRVVPNPVPARERAISRGWFVDPELSAGHHGLGRQRGTFFPSIRERE